MAVDYRRQSRYKTVLRLVAGLLLFDGTSAFVASQNGSSFVVKSSDHVRRPPNKHGNKSTSSSALSGMWSQDEEIEGSDRIKACIPYLLPLMDGDTFGHYIYDRIPVLGAINDVTIGPLAAIGRSIPFLSLGLFVALTLGTRFNTDMPRTLRFSAQQAALIDVALIFPQLIASGFEEDPVPQYIAEPCANFVWYAYMSIVIYCVYTNLRGKKPDQIPFVSQQAEIMVGPF